MATIGEQSRDRNALAAMIYGEARNQTEKGKIAAAYTAVTRAALADVSVADAVYGSQSRKFGQYSFANPNDPNRRAVMRAPEVDPQGWQDALDVADAVLSGEVENPVPGATNYKVTGTKAAWSKTATPLGEVDSHSFYSLPDREVRSVVRNSAFSPHRRVDLIDAASDDETGLAEADAAGTVGGLPGLDGTRRSISLGEFDFSKPSVERGFSRMNPETRHLASEIARTLPDDQRMTVTATHGQHNARNKTHTPGAAFDVRTRGLTDDQMDGLVTSTLYSQPASIGINSGLGKFAKHMHVDTNAGYGTGLQSHSDLTGLPDFARQELERYNAEMAAGLGYTPPVPLSIAPVPETKPTLTAQAMPSIASADDLGALTGGLSAEVGARPGDIPSMTPDGVPIGKVTSMRVTPSGMIQNVDPRTPADMADRKMQTAAAPEAEMASVTPSLSANPSLSSVGVGIGANAVGSLDAPDSMGDIDVDATGISGVGTMGQASTGLTGVTGVSPIGFSAVAETSPSMASFDTSAHISTPEERDNLAADVADQRAANLSADVADQSSTIGVETTPDSSIGSALGGTLGPSDDTVGQGTVGDIGQGTSISANTPGASSLGSVTTNPGVSNVSAARAADAIGALGAPADIGTNQTGQKGLGGFLGGMMDAIGSLFGGDAVGGLGGGLGDSFGGGGFGGFGGGGLTGENRGERSVGRN